MKGSFQFLGKSLTSKTFCSPFEVSLISIFSCDSGRYTTVGRDILPQIKTGDIIRSAKLVEGQDRLVLPNEN